MTVHLCAMVSIGALPLLVFARGRANLAWWATAWPFFAAPVGVLACVTGILPVLWDLNSTPAQVLRGLGLVASVAGINLIAWTGLSHPVRPSLWHQSETAPRSFVCSGPYGRIRHPFYTAFLLILTGSFLGFPNALGGIAASYAAVALTVTAMREERTFLGSTLGLAYARYMRNAGRFLPRLHTSMPTGENQ